MSRFFLKPGKDESTRCVRNQVYRGNSSTRKGFLILAANASCWVLKNKGRENSFDEQSGAFLTMAEPLGY